MKRRSALFGSFIGVVLGAALAPTTAHAGGCCGGGFAVPSLIAGDDKAQLTTELSYGWIPTDVSAKGIWSHRQTLETTTSMRLSGAVAILDRAQVGANVPFIQRSRAANAQAGLGDAGLTAGYEILTDWDYSNVRPKLSGFLTVGVPTGQSANEAADPMLLDARGRGFWSVGAGLLATKSIRKWDLFGNTEIHKSFAKKSNSQSGEIEEYPGLGGSIGIGLGFNKNSWRIGLAISSLYEEPIESRGAVNGSGNFSRSTSFTMSTGHDFAVDDGILNATLAFTDQTLLGAPLNSTLAKTFLLSLSRRWAR